MTLAVDFIGHSALLIELDGIRLLTDPVTRARVGPLRRVEPVPDRHRLAGVDAVLISHLHWDHLDVPSLRSLGGRVPIVVPAGSGAWMRAAGFTHVQELGVGGTVDIGGVEVRAVEALHSGFRPPLGPTAPAMGFVLRGSRSVYFAGDTDLCEAMWSLGDIDLALIPVWGWGPTLGRGLHLDPLKAAEALRRIRPRRRGADPLGHVLAARDGPGVSRSGWWSLRPRSWNTPRSSRRTSGCCRPRSAMRWRWTREGRSRRGTRGPGSPAAPTGAATLTVSPVG